MLSESMNCGVTTKSPELPWYVLLAPPPVRHDERHIKTKLEPPADRCEDRIVTEVLAAVPVPVVVIGEVEEPEAVEDAVESVDPALAWCASGTAGRVVPGLEPPLGEKRTQRQRPPRIVGVAEKGLENHVNRPHFNVRECRWRRGSRSSNGRRQRCSIEIADDVGKLWRAGWGAWRDCRRRNAGRREAWAGKVLRCAGPPQPRIKARPSADQPPASRQEAPKREAAISFRLPLKRDRATAPVADAQEKVE